MNRNYRVEIEVFVATNRGFFHVHSEPAAYRDKSYRRVKEPIYKRHIAEKVGIAGVVYRFVAEFYHEPCRLTEINPFVGGGVNGRHESKRNIVESDGAAEVHTDGFCETQGIKVRTNLHYAYYRGIFADYRSQRGGVVVVSVSKSNEIGVHKMRIFTDNGIGVARKRVDDYDFTVMLQHYACVFYKS